MSVINKSIVTFSLIVLSVICILTPPRMMASGDVQEVQRGIVVEYDDSADYCEADTTVYIKQHWYSVPSTYVPELATMKIGKTAPCNNSPGEKFSDFIKRFNIDKAFRSARCRPSEAQPFDDLIMPYTDILKTAVEVFASNGYFPFEGHAEGEDEFGQPIRLGTWYDIEPDSVIYSTWIEDPSDSMEMGSALVLFEKIDGLWYFADCYPFGLLHSAIIKSLEDQSVTR